MRTFTFLVGFLFSILAYALPASLPEDFADPNLEVVCHSALNKKDVTVLTVDTKAMAKAANPRPENFQVNVWQLARDGAKLKFLFGSPGSIQLLEKKSSNTKGGGQKSFDTWIIKTHLEDSNPVNHEVIVIDRAVDEKDSPEIAATLVRSPLLKEGEPVVGMSCPVFKLE